MSGFALACCVRAGRHGLLAVAVAWRLLTGATLLAGQEWTLRLDLHGQRVTGSPLAWSAERVTVLGRDGRLWDFAPGEAENYRKTPGGFRSYSASEMRGQLLREFGRQFDVSGTGHYLVVHPSGQRDRWAPWFEDLHRSFVHYFTVRGMRPQPPQFPLVGVVFPRRQDFVRYASETGSPVGPGVVGYYSTVSNRILLYDAAGGKEDKARWRATAETIIHEATHQTAFNTGIHSRFTPPPLWAVEGLATLFEARGVWDSEAHRQRSDRINRERLEAFRRYEAARRRPGAAAELVSSDRMFQKDPVGAYAESWALTFFLTETRPRQYMQYVSLCASKPPFSAYPPQERLRDFHQAFGSDMDMFQARFLRFMKQLK